MNKARVFVIALAMVPILMAYAPSQAGGFTLRIVNQAAYSNQWVSL